MTEDGVKRKLRAILAADVVGYTRLMGEDEEGTLAALKAHQADFIDPIVEEYRGRVVKLMGDGVLIEFASVVDALKCAVAVQRGMPERNADVPGDRQIIFRIGINLGDVIMDGDDIYGNGVNVAARLEALSDPGGICISGRVLHQVEKNVEVGFASLGPQKVKNIAKPINAYKVLLDPEAAGTLVDAPQAKTRSRMHMLTLGVVLLVAVIGAFYWHQHNRPEIEPASVEKMAFPLPDKPSIAVLPFDNMSEDPKQEYFCDGLTENMIAALSKTPQMFVIARNSTFTYKGKAVKVNQIAEELGVQYVLEGSVRKEGDRVRITAQLIDALTGHHLWAEKYDRELKEIFSLQDEITKKIITSLQMELTEGEQANVYAKGTDNLEAYLKTMRANFLYLNGTKDGLLKALDLAQEAIGLDPNYAFAYKVLGGANGITLWRGLSKNPKETLNQTIALHQKSVELDDSLAIAHVGLGYWQMYTRQHAKAVAEGERAFVLEPGSADVVHLYATILTYAGRREEAIPLFEEALRLNPKPPNSYLRHYSMALRDTERYQEAIALMERAIKNEPDDIIAWVQKACVSSLMGREEEAQSAALEVLRINPKFSVSRIEKITPHKDRAFAKQFGDCMRKAGLPE